MKRIDGIILVLLLTLAACKSAPPADTRPGETPMVGRCGNGICEGPENPQLCPQDCAEAKPDTPTAPEEKPPATGDSKDSSSPSNGACTNPNPHRAVVSQELLEFRNVLLDGSFEEGLAEVVIDETDQKSMGRVQAAARTGSWGYAIQAGPNKGATFAIKAYIEKGEVTRYSFWVRSLNGQAMLRPKIYWVMEQAALDEPWLAEPARIGPEWTQVSFAVENTRGIRYALLSVEVEPNTRLHLDDVQVESTFWRLAEIEGPGRVMGGIKVPARPVAPVHISFLIHIEDPALIQNNETFFRLKTAVFRELARTFYEHGGRLTIQPEQDWPMAAENKFEPGLLADLAEQYNVVYSTHTHGPNCRDDRSKLRSAEDCNQNPAWDRQLKEEDVLEYVGELRALLSQASGLTVTDHNGNWDFAQTSRYADISILTLSGYKNKHNQATYDRLINNPWRPGQVNANENIEAFLTHHPETKVIYIPGWGQAATRHPERVLPRLRPMISQFIAHADPERVNTFYAILHVDHFYSRAGNPDYIAYNEATGEITYSAEFEQHLQAWDDMLTELIDPLVAEGYLEWTSIPQMGVLYLEWEAACKKEG
ncbi:MAG: hypothetical protein JW953_24525 [Anaerolineae bacterium]|nr:hypothetical protein [Anaerolineae bacterium]